MEVSNDEDVITTIIQTHETPIQSTHQTQNRVSENQTRNKSRKNNFAQTSSPAIRRSSRGRIVRLRNPIEDEVRNTSIPKKIRIRRKIIRPIFHNVAELPFCCDRCKSPYIVNPLKKTNRVTKKKPTPRYRMDPITKKLLTLCNACGLAMGNLIRTSKTKSKPSPISTEEKQKYLDEGKTFVSLLADTMDNPSVAQFYCVKFSKQGCGCLQTFLKADGNLEEAKKRANILLDLSNEAKRLSQLKCYTENDQSTGSPSHKSHRCRGSIGLGNGQKRSAQFEKFVLTNRQYLREELSLCERATQTLLCYSNNFLHKKLKTDPEKGPRVQRKKGKAAMGLLIPIKNLPIHRCCNTNCVAVATTYPELLSQLRERAALGQAEARRVIAEMLTPSGGARTNCYRFIEFVTGCSHSTICNVSEQMRRTGGNREPPEHGLKQWWKEHPRPKPPAELNEEMEGNNPAATETSKSVSALLSSEESDTTLQLQMYQQQLLQLQEQVSQQKIQIQQQQEIINQQLSSPPLLPWQEIQQVMQPNDSSQDLTPIDTSDILAKATETLQNEDHMSNAERIFQNMLNCPSDSSSSQAIDYLSNTITELPPGVNVTFLQQPMNKSDSTSQDLTLVSTSDILAKATETLQNEDHMSTAEKIFQKMLLNCPSDSSSSQPIDYMSNTITELPPGVNITILQQPLSESDSTSTDHVTSQMLAAPGYENFILINPTLVPSSDSQIETSTTNISFTPANWEEN